MATPESETYYADFDANQDASRDVADCACGGCGWLLSQLDTWHQCRAHYDNQPHPEDCER